MKDIKELKKICQSAIQKNYSWWLRYVSRKLSIYFTALLIKTNITANQVTFLSLIAGFIMVGFFAVGMPWAVFLGALSFQLFYILDCSDGEVARYRMYSNLNKVIIDKSACLTGTFFDSLVHYLLIPLLFFAIAFGQYRILESFYVIVLGFVAGISTILIDMLSDCKTKCLIANLKKHEGMVVEIKRQTSDVEKQIGQRPVFERIFSLLHHTCFFYNIMNVLGVVALLNMFKPGFNLGRLELNWVLLFLFYYAFVATVVWVLKAVKIITGGKVDKEFSESFKIIRNED